MSWTPCTDGMPPKGTLCVLSCLDFAGDPHVVHGCWARKNAYWLVLLEGKEPYLARLNYEVIAWQPVLLPEAYPQPQ